MASKGKAAKPAPTSQDSDPIVRQLQTELKQQGFFPYEIDGKAGQKTTDAVAARDAKKAADETRAMEMQRLQQSGKAVDASAAEATRQTQARQARDEAGATPLGLAARTAAITAGPIVGTGVGLLSGDKVNRLMDASQASKNAVLQGAAQDRIAGLTSLEGARAGAKLSGAMPSANPLLRVGGRMLPHAILGGLAMGKGATMLAEGDPEGAFFPEMVNRGVGLGMVGAGGGLMKRGAQYAVSPGVAPDARSIAIINSNQLRRNPLMPQAPAQGIAQAAPDVTGQAALPSPTAPAAPRPDTHAGMLAQARKLKIPGRSTMNKADLANAIADSIKAQGATRAKRLPKVAGAAGPALAAGLAYAATPDQAQAADGSSPGMNSDAITNAGVAGGVAYGVQKGIDALPSAVGGAVRAAGAGMTPANIDAMTDYSPDELAQGRNMLARNLPSALRGGAVEDAYQMAQVPEPSPMRGQAPQDAGGADEFETQLAALHDLLAQIGPDEPVANAVASQRINAMPPVSRPMQQNRLLAGR